MILKLLYKTFVLATVDISQVYHYLTLKNQYKKQSDVMKF